MKNLNRIISLTSLFCMTGLVQAASTGTITFSGELTANTGDVSVDGQGADATVVLPTVSTSQLDAATKTAGETGFVMALNNCANTLQTASAFFESGTSVDLVNGRLKNMTGNATNVSLQLLDASSSSQSVIHVGNTNQTTGNTYVNVSSGTANLPYTVRYYAEDETTAGTVGSNVVYSIQYQ